jgi:hypothetical protein
MKLGTKPIQLLVIPQSKFNLSKINSKATAVQTFHALTAAKTHEMPSEIQSANLKEKSNSIDLNKG